MKKRQKVVITAGEGNLVMEVLKKRVPKRVWVIENPRTTTHNHSYGGISKFFRGLTRGKLFGTHCARCASAIWLPPRVDCPDCWSKMEWVEVDAAEARVYSYSITKYPGAGFKGSVPCPLISLEIPGVCTNIMGYLSEFAEDEPYIGMPVKPVFRKRKPTRTILDLSWTPVD